jgi:hypothetical protein
VRHRVRGVGVVSSQSAMRAMLQAMAVMSDVGLGQASVAGSTQPSAADVLGDGRLDPGADRVAQLPGFGGLFESGPGLDLMQGLRQQHHGPGPGGRAGASGAVRAGQAGRLVEAGLDVVVAGDRQGLRSQPVGGEVVVDLLDDLAVLHRGDRGRHMHDHVRQRLVTRLREMYPVTRTRDVTLHAVVRVGVVRGVELQARRRQRVAITPAQGAVGIPVGSGGPTPAAESPPAAEP